MNIKQKILKDFEKQDFMFTNYEGKRKLYTNQDVTDKVYNWHIQKVKEILAKENELWNKKFIQSQIKLLEKVKKEIDRLTDKGADYGSCSHCWGDNHDDACTCDESKQSFNTALRFINKYINSLITNLKEEI